jgi:hypothetical protein
MAAHSRGLRCGITDRFYFARTCFQSYTGVHQYPYNVTCESRARQFKDLRNSEIINKIKDLEAKWRCRDMFAGGAILVMLADTMIPEAFEHGGKPASLVKVMGFALAAYFSTIS